jgi:WW domain
MNHLDPKRLVLFAMLMQKAWSWVPQILPHVIINSNNKNNKPRRLLYSSTTQLLGIRCDNKYYQLEEMEDRETCTTELFLKEDGTVLLGDTDGPLWESATGYWQVKPGTDDFSMSICKSFRTGSENRDMGEFEFQVTRTFEGEMIMVGESVAITGVMKHEPDDQEQQRQQQQRLEVGFFNMIDSTEIRIDKRLDTASTGVGKQAVPVKNDASATHKGAVPLSKPTVTVGLAAGWEEYFDLGQQKYYYVNTKTGISQWEKPMGSQQQPTATTSSATTDLPVGWQQYFDADQQAYYYVDTTTGKSQWEMPKGQPQQPQLELAQGGGVLPAGWQEYFDPGQQRNYYVNSASGASQWERPQ